MNPQNLDLGSRENKLGSTKQHKIFLLNLAKEYLLICQKIGVQPLQNELECQLKAMTYDRSKEGTNDIMFEHWANCPLPPPKGTELK